MHIYCTLVGTHFRGSDAKRIVNALTPDDGTEFRLEREPDNEYDPNAVAVYVEDEHVGYVSRQNNSELAEAIDLGCECNVRMIDKEGSKPVLSIEWHDDAA